MHKRWLAILTLTLLLALLPGWNTASANESDQAFLQKYRDLYGYTDTTTQMYKPTFLNFVGFTRYLARDSGIADGMIYTLHGSVTPQRVEEYLTYLARFGYAITVDATQDGVRFVEVRNVGAPVMLPKNFRFYYHAEDQAIVTMDPDSAEQAYEQFCLLREQRFQAELNVPKTLENGVAVQLKMVRSTAEYTVDAADFPLWTDALPDLSARSLVQPLPEQSLRSGNTQVWRVTPPEDVNHFAPAPYWLLQVEIDPQGQTLALNDLEFCVAQEDVLVAYPLHGGTAITENGDVPLLHGGVPGTIDGATTLWLTFPALTTAMDAPMRLYVAYARDQATLPERLSFGFYGNQAE